MKRNTVLACALAAALSGGLVGSAAPQDADSPRGGYGYGPGPGMMGGYGPGYGPGPGMMGGYGPGYGRGPGMMGGYGPGYGMGPGMMGGYGRGYGMGPGMMGYGALYGLQLSDDQRSKVQNIQDGAYKKNLELSSKMFDASRKLRDSLASAKPDRRAVAAAYKEVSDLRFQRLQIQLDAREQVDAVLTPEQRKQLQGWRAWSPAWASVDD